MKPTKALRNFVQATSVGRVLNRYLEASERVAVEFPNDAALQKYLKDHPKANRKNHRVMGDPTEQGKKAPKESVAHPGQMRLLGVKPVPRKKRSPNKPKAQKEAPETKSEESKDEKSESSSEAPKLKISHPFQQKNLKIQSRKRIGEGMTSAEMLTVTDDQGKTHKGIWKNVNGEFLSVEKNYGYELRENIPAGTYYQREALSSNFDEIFGGKRVVPHTYEQEFEDDDSGKKVLGSLQEYAPGTISQDDMLSASGGRWNMKSEEFKKLGSSFEAKKMFFMDLISANDDRHSGNSLWKKDRKHGYVPVAIDNGLTFPDGESSRFLFAIDKDAFSKEVSKPSEEITKCLKDLNLQKLADQMNSVKDLHKTAKLLTLARAQALKNNPNLAQKIIVGHTGDHEKDSDGDEWGSKYGEYLFNWVNLDGTARVENGEITQEQYDKIRKMVSK